MREFFTLGRSFNRVARCLNCIVFMLLFTSEDLSALPLFAPPESFPSGGLGAHSLAVADVNGDGRPDLLVANLCVSSNDCHGGMGVLLANGDGSFQPAKTFSIGTTFAAAIAVGDVNRDGTPDVTVTGGGTCSPTCLGSISILLGNGDGSFGTPQIYSSGNYAARDLTLDDVNGDGDLDLLVANGSVEPNLGGPGAIGVLLGNGDGTFQAVQSYISGGSYLTSLATGDVNGDGKLDIVAVPTGLGVGVLLGNGDGTFQTSQNYDSRGFTGSAIALADMNLDGKLDVLVSNGCYTGQTCYTGRVAVLLGNGDGTFQPGQNYDTTVRRLASSLAVADANGDGRPDLLLVHECQGYCNSSPVIVMLGNGDGTFKSPLRYYSGGKDAVSIVATDVNGDSKPDLLIANESFSYENRFTGSVGVLLGNWGVRTTSTLTSGPNSSTYGQAVTLTATVTSAGPSTPTGTVRFMNGTTGLGSATLVDGVATLRRTDLPAGTLSLIATYNGDPDSAKSNSAPLRHTVEQASTITTIKSSSNPSLHGQAVMFTAKVTSPTAPHVTGTVTFTLGSTILGAAAIVGGKASLITRTLPKGSNQAIRGTYSGTANIAGSAASLFQTVN
jgi:hypothetical protein